MLNARGALLAALAAVGIVHVGYWVARLRADDGHARARLLPSPEHLGIGFFTNFFDTLGIGSFAPTTALFKLRGLVSDERIPGTLNVGHTPPVIVQAFVFVAIIVVDPLTLVVMITASVLGAWWGAGVVATLPRRRIQLGMAGALVAAAAFFAMTNLGWFPTGGEGTELRGGTLLAAAAVNALLGALNTLGVGLYAPCMVLVSLLGMSPKAAFPIMMGSCAFLMPAGSLRFVQERAYDVRPALGLALGGLPAVLLAAFVVKELPVAALRWLVVAVVLYTSWAMWRSARLESS